MTTLNEKKLHSRLILTAVLTYLVTGLNAQRLTIYQYQDLTTDLTNRYLIALSTEDAWSPFVRKLEDLTKDMEEDLKAGSGLTFNDMNMLRHLKANLRKMNDFGYGVAVGSYFKTFNGRMFREIREVFPEITMELLTTNSCVSFYRIKFYSFVAVVARHNERGVEKEINYWDQSSKCGSVAFGGTITIYPGIYRTFWQNYKCPAYNGYGIYIKGCKFESTWDTTFEPVKSFVE